MRQRQLQWYRHGQRGESEEDVKHVTETKTTGKKKPTGKKKKRKGSNGGDLIPQEMT